MSNIFEIFQFMPDQNLVLIGKDTTVMGLFVSLNRDKTRLELQDVFDLRTNKTLGKTKFFYHQAIQKIQVKTDTQTLLTIDDTKDSRNATSTTLTKISSHQKVSIEKNILSFSFIQSIKQTDKNYQIAINQLIVQPCIGLTYEGCENGRLSKLSMLALSTSTNIFIFDIIFLGNKIPKELKMILEDQSICKVIHNALLLCDALYHSFEVDMSNIFDTMLASFLCNQYEENEHLEDCINKHLGLNLNLHHKSSRYYSNQRPVPIEDLHHLSRNCGYLIFLYHFLISKDILSTHYSIIDEHCKSTKSYPIEDIGMFISKHKPWKEFKDKHKDFKFV